MRDGKAALLRYQALRTDSPDAEPFPVLMRACNGFEVDLPDSHIVILDPADLEDIADQIAPYLPGATVFGATDMQYVFLAASGGVYCAERGWLEQDERNRIADDLDDFAVKALDGTLPEVL